MTAAPHGTMLSEARKTVALRAIRMGLSLPGRPLEAFAEHASLRDIIRELGINVVLDVGANAGQFAAGVRSIGFPGRIVSFEPVRRDFDALTRRMGRDAEWRGMHMALGDADGTAEINVVPSMTVMNSLLAPITASRTLETETVQVRRLDGILAGLLADVSAPRCLLKMDTQGFDLRCFAGAGGCLGQVVALFSELSVKQLYQRSPHYRDWLAVYEKAGFELMRLPVVSRREGAVQEMNCLMRRVG